MLSTDILISFIFMALLFLRHVAISKRPNKINYAPLMLGVGGIATLIHFIVYAHIGEIVPLLQESLFPFLVSLLFYIVMNIVNQTKESFIAQQHEAFSNTLVHELSELKAFMLALEVRMQEYSQQTLQRQEALREEFKKDIETLWEILQNQKEFTKRFENLEKWYEDVRVALDELTKKQIPAFDEMMHRHIDMLRVVEKEHYDELNKVLKKVILGKEEMTKEFKNLHKELLLLKSLSDSISRAIITQTKEGFVRLAQELESEMLSLKLNAEGIKTLLLEDENILGSIRSESELIIKQMVLSSKNMNELQKQSSEIKNIMHRFALLSQNVHELQSAYELKEEILRELIEDFKDSSKKEEREILETLEKLLTMVEGLKTEYKEARENMHEQTQFLAKRIKLQQGYTEFDDNKRGGN